MFTTFWASYEDALYDAYRASQILGIYVNIKRVTLVTAKGLDKAWKLNPVW